MCKCITTITAATVCVPTLLLLHIPICIYSSCVPSNVYPLQCIRCGCYCCSQKRVCPKCLPSMCRCELATAATVYKLRCYCCFQRVTCVRACILAAAAAILCLSTAATARFDVCVPCVCRVCAVCVPCVCRVCAGVYLLLLLLLCAYPLCYCCCQRACLRALGLGFLAVAHLFGA